MRYLKALALGLGLVACDDPATIITHVDKLPHMKMEDLWTMQDGRGIPVEIHGSPFANMADRDLAEALRPPAGAAQKVRFYSRPVGTWKGGHGYRLVLHFNAQGAPNAYEDCKRVAEARTNKPALKGFTVNASFCKGAEWQAHGFLQVPDAEPGDMDVYGNAFTQLLMAIFREEPDR